MRIPHLNLMKNQMENLYIKLGEITLQVGEKSPEPFELLKKLGEGKNKLESGLNLIFEQHRFLIF